MLSLWREQCAKGSTHSQLSLQARRLRGSQTSGISSVVKRRRLAAVKADDALQDALKDHLRLKAYELFDF